jgi:hypothetical protein
MDGDELYGLPLDRFVPERAALAKALRSDGDRTAASEVAALRKPSVAAWAVNQLVRTQPRAIKELYASGDDLVSAQERLMSGDGDSRSLREANARERSAVDALLALARGLLTSDGHELSPPILDRVADTLHAAALDDEARDAIRDGRLERELQHAGLGAVGLAVGKRAPREQPEAAPAAAREEVRRAEPREVERARKEARRAARVAEADARRRAGLASRAVRAAEQRREVAASALEEAEEALRRARTELADSEEAHQRAKSELDEL